MHLTIISITIFLEIALVKYAWTTNSRMGKCLRAAHGNLFCIWGFNTTPLCSLTEALRRKAANKNPWTSLSPCEFSHLQLSQQTRSETGWIINTPRPWQGEKLSKGRGGGGRQDRDRKVERVWGVEWSSTRFPLHCFWWLLNTKGQIAFRRQTSFMYILHYPYPNSSSEGLIIIPLSSYCSLSLG